MLVISRLVARLNLLVNRNNLASKSLTFLIPTVRHKRKTGMKEHIKPNKISFKIGSLEWLTFFGLPIALITNGLISGYFYLKDMDSIKASDFLTVSILTLSLGIITYLLQIKRLKYKTFKLTKELEEFRKQTRTILTENNWRIENDNQKFIVASSKGKRFSSDMIILRFKKEKIQWNLIQHPWSHNSGAALLNLNLKGKKILEKIKASA